MREIYPKVLVWERVSAGRSDWIENDGSAAAYEYAMRSDYEKVISHRGRLPDRDSLWDDKARWSKATYMFERIMTEPKDNESPLPGDSPVKP